MTPALRQCATHRGLLSGAVGAYFEMLLLAAFFLPAREPITHGLALEWRPSAELVGLLLLIATGALVRSGWVAGRGPALFLALLVVAAALLNLADALTPTLLGRDLNLYWDLPHLPSLFGLAHASAGLWSILAIALIVIVLMLGIAATYWVWRQLLVTLADRRIAIGAVLLLGLSLGVTAFVPDERRPLATGFGGGIVRQAAAFQRALRLHSGSDAPMPAALATAGPVRSDLAGLKQQDVYLVYIESYGTTVFDTPEFRAALREPLAQFEAALSRSGYSVASDRLISPTFGGGSWLAHATLASGVRLDDPILYSQLLTSGRKLLPVYFKDAGWRTLDIMPGVKEPSAEVARAWGFDRNVYAADLHYHGPSFGWFAIPDQFTLDRAFAIRAAMGWDRPVFTQIVLVSSHIPFSPVPPYLPDWKDSGAFATVPAAAWDEIYRQPNWTVLAPSYLKSLKYDFIVLGDWLANHLPGNGLVILLGDHQPPAAVGGAPQQWTVPVHVVSRDRDLLAPFIARGYVAGLVPTQRTQQGMERFLPSFLAAFDLSGGSGDGYSTGLNHNVQR
jgi:Sulfatase